ncbi:Na+/H+ antiporter NhaC family protein [Arenicella chitinivorans]|nr:Na+/H+ antiporter NhaC family protein [Arenicella chitinivorans]
MNTTRISIGLALLVSLVIWGLRPDPTGTHYGLWSLLPSVVTIGICFLTRNVLLALLLGVATGGLVSGQLNIIDAFLVPSLGSEKYAQILLVYLWALGGLLGLWNRNGGARHFAETLATRLVKSRISAKVFAWSMGVFFHQGGTISTVLAGTTVKPVADKHGVAHEELAYIVDSTASPVATLIPFNVWPVYVAGLITIAPLSTIVPNEEVAIGLFLAAIPFNFYAMFAVSMTFLFAIDRLPLFGTPMKSVVQRIQVSGELDAPNANPMAAKELTASQVPQGYQPSVLDFLVPIGVLLGFCIIPIVLGKSPLVFEGFGMAVMAACLTSVLRGMSIQTAFEAMVTGIKGVTIGALVLGLAVTLADVSESLGTAEFVIDIAAGVLSGMPYILPSVLLLICMIVAFSIGSSWGTYAVVFPIALPLAWAVAPEMTYLLLCFGAILGGAVFGDQCSPVSDTTILSALACGSDLMDHVNTQLPLALIAATLAGITYLVVSLLVL